jgi:hypothetical protein
VARCEVSLDTVRVKALPDRLVRNAKLIGGHAQTRSVDHLRYRRTVLG